MSRCYRELRRFDSFEDRFHYLNLNGRVGDLTFGHNRYMNQDFYTSVEWRSVRDRVIDRDRGCDLGVPGHEIYGDILVHHMEPMCAHDLIHGEMWILDPEYLITTTKRTHNAIHYGDASQLPREYVPRSRGDTKLW